MAYTFLLFDLDHTLLDFESAEETALTQMLEDMNFPDVQAFKDYYKPMNQGLWKDLEQKKLTKQELVDSRFAIGFAHFGITVDGAEMALRYQDYISLQGQSFPGAEDLLARLEKAGYQLYGATNGVTAIQKDAWLILQSHHISKRSLSLSSFILRNQNLHFLTKLAN